MADLSDIGVKLLKLYLSDPKLCKPPPLSFAEGLRRIIRRLVRG